MSDFLELLAGPAPEHKAGLSRFRNGAAAGTVSRRSVGSPAESSHRPGVRSRRQPPAAF